MTIWKTLKQWSRLVWLLVFLAMIGVLTSAMRTKRQAPAGDWHIEIQPAADGGLAITETDVRALLEDKKSKDDILSLDELPAAALEARLHAHPQVERADVFIDTRRRVTIRIKQPELLIRVIDRNGANYYLSDTGRKVPLSRHHTPRVPVVTGDIPLFQDSLVHQEGHVLNQLHAIAQALRRDAFTNALVEQIHYADQEFTLVPKMGRFRILLGDSRSLEEKLAFIRTFYKEILPTAGWETYRLIDVRYKGQIVCRKA
jgi:cell division protein FtsQ